MRMTSNFSAGGGRPVRGWFSDGVDWVEPLEVGIVCVEVSVGVEAEDDAVTGGGGKDGDVVE